MNRPLKVAFHFLHLNVRLKKSMQVFVISDDIWNSDAVDFSRRNVGAAGQQTVEDIAMSSPCSLCKTAEAKTISGYITSTIKSTIKVSTLKYNWSNISVNLCQSSLSIRCLIIQTCSKPNQLIQNANTTLKSTKTIRYRCQKYNY